VTPESAVTVSIRTSLKIESARRFLADSLTRALSYGWPGANSSSRRMTYGRVAM
jgi:hypothetical protein